MGAKVPVKWSSLRLRKGILNPFFRPLTSSKSSQICSEKFLYSQLELEKEGVCTVPLHINLTVEANLK